MSGLFAQYAGQPWGGTPWQFGTDSLANFSVGQNLNWKNGPYHGVPHYAYDVGVVDTLLIPSGDPNGTLVAGSGILGLNSGPSTDDQWRQVAAAAAGITLHNSDLAAQTSANFGGNFTTHNNRAVVNGTSGWYRYTCNFVEGNYKMVIRGWSATKSGHGFWIRFYDPQTMTPLYPWTRIHPGSAADSPIDLENASFVDLTQTFYATNLLTKEPTQSGWIQTTDEFSLNGVVVVEYSNMGPTLNHDEDVTGSGAGFWGDFCFMHQSDVSDKFAPVAEVYKSMYDDMEEMSLKLSEAGTLYLVPKGTAMEDAETAAIDMMEMTTTSTYTKAVSEMNLSDTIQLVTKDAAGNKRITAPISFRAALTVDTTQGKTLDTLVVNTTREGFVILLDKSVNPDFVSFMNAIGQGLADTINVDGGNDTLIITNLTGDMNCNLYLFDMESGEVSNPVAFTLGEGSPSGIDDRKVIDVNVYARQNQILINHTGIFTELAIFDVLGKKYIHEAVNSDRISINSEGLTSGVYVLRMYGNSVPVTKKFIISK